MPALLKTTGLTKRFGGLTAVSEVDMQVPEGITKALIGPNGAGKSTLLNLLTGVIPGSDGTIEMGNVNITSLPCFEISRLGIARTFQNLQLFENMSVIENVMVGCHSWGRQGMASGAVRWIGHLREEHAIRQEAEIQLERVGLLDLYDLEAGSLPFGKQRLLEIARALASRPKIVMLDEPASGLSTKERVALGDLLAEIVDEGITILVVDHDMQFVMEISDEVMVLDQGRKIAEGTPEEVQNSECVIAAYLGEETDVC